MFDDIRNHLQTEEEAKVIVFSAFPEPLVQISHLLDKAQVQYSSGSLSALLLPFSLSMFRIVFFIGKAISGLKNSGKLSTRIHKFRSDNNTRVLLLNVLN